MCESKRRFPNLGRRWPFFRYPGSKWRLMPRFIELFPPQHDHYVSVFGGSAADILAKPPARTETFNDLDDHIYTLFAVVRDERRAGRLRELLAVTPRHMRVYREALEILARPIADPIETAWAFLVVAHQGLCLSHPALQGPSQFAVMRKPGTDRRWLTLPERLSYVVRRFRRVTITQLDWRKVVRRCDSPTTFFFLDPPYHPDTIEWQLYGREMSPEEHREMLATLGSIEGYAMLCGYDHPLYREHLVGWRREEFGVRASMSTKKSRPPRTEVVWMNYDERGRKIGGR